MTNNLINIILATCLLFSSLNLAAEQITLSNSKAEALFLAGETCIKQANSACAMASLAKIPNSSPYAKLLQGEIAYTHQSLDQALQLLLPLQVDPQLNTSAKVSLHQYLAKAFAQLEDFEQTLIHLLQVDLLLLSIPNNSQQNAIDVNQTQIWELLTKLNQSELLTIRGNNTDDNLQGWIDLALAAKHQDIASHLKSWQLSYPFHAAVTLATKLQLSDTSQHALQVPKLLTTNPIAVSYTPTSDADQKRAEAFKAGLNVALAHYNLDNTILLDNDSYNNTDPADESATVAQLNTAYAIYLDFSQTTTEAPHQQIASQTLILGFDVNAEAAELAKFATKNAIRNAAVLINDSATSAKMLQSLDTAWQQAFNLDKEHNSFNIISLPQNITSNDPSLLDIQTKINTKIHDMIILALPAMDARIIKPYLNVGTPTLAFSNIHETANDPTLNTVRFVDIPFLLPANTQFSTFQSATTTLPSNDLIRWYALGIDALSILTNAQQNSRKETLINGLTGEIRIINGSITRKPSMARFTYEGIIKEQ